MSFVKDNFASYSLKCPKCFLSENKTYFLAFKLTEKIFAEH